MILEAICKASPMWIKEMEETGTPIYEFEQEWPVTVEVTNLSESLIETRILVKDTQLHLLIRKSSKGYRLDWKDINWNYHLDYLADFSNDEALAVIKTSSNPVAIQSIAAAVRIIAERIQEFNQ